MIPATSTSTGNNTDKGGKKKIPTNRVSPPTQPQKHPQGKGGKGNSSKLLVPEPSPKYKGPGQIVSAGEDDFLTICTRQSQDIFNDRQPTFTKKLNYRVFAALVLPGGRMLIGGAPDGSIDVVHPDTGAIEMTMSAKGHSDSVMALALSSHGLFSASADHNVVRWNLRGLSHIKTFYGHEGMVTSLCSAPTPGFTGLFSAGDDQSIIQWNIETGTAINEFDEHRAAIYCMKATGQNLFSADGDGKLHVYDIANRYIIFRLNAHNAEIWTMALDEETGTLYTGAGDGLIKVWGDLVGTKQKDPAAVLTGHRGAVRALHLDEEGSLFSGGQDSLVVCWDVEEVASAMQGTREGEVVEIMRLYTDSRTVPCQKSITAMGFANNELIAVGFDRVINRWDVTDLLNVVHDIDDLLPLNAVEEAEHDQLLAKLSPQERHPHYVNLDVSEAVNKYTELPLLYIIESLNFKVESSWLTSEFVVYVPFLIMFLFFFLYDYNAQDIFYMNYGIESLLEGEDIGQFKVMRNFLSINSAHWWNTWVSTLFFGQLWAGKGATAWYEPFRFQGQNQLIGAVRFRTQRVTNTSCVVSEDRFNREYFQAAGAAADSNNTTISSSGTNSAVISDDNDRLLPYEACYGPHHAISLEGLATDGYACIFPAQTGCVANATQMQETLGLVNGTFEYIEEAGTLYRGLKFYPPGGYVVDIPGVLSETDAINMADVMIDNGFVDNTATRFVVIEFFSYNPELQLYSQNRMTAEVYAGGTWYMNVQHLPFKIFKLETSKFRLVYEAIFLCFVTYWFINYFTDMAEHNKVYGTIIGYVFCWWNLLDFVNVVLFYAMFYYRIKWFSRSQTASLQMPFDGRTYPSQLDTMAEDYQIQVTINAINTIFTFLKMLKYMQLNDQLNILTRTLGAAQQNIIGVLTLFIYFVFAFALTAMAVYGNNVFGFRTLDASYNTLMRTLVGDQDYEALSIEAREWTPGYFWAFVICAQFILLNFLIAVLSDAFQEVCDNRLPISIDKAIVRAAQNVKKNFLPGYLRITIMLLYNRNSRTDLVAKQVRFLRKYRDVLLSEDAKKYKDYDELEYFYISKDWFCRNVPQELRTSDNLNFMDEIYFDMSWEWHYRLKDKNNKQRHEQQEIVDTVLSHELVTMKRSADELQEALKTVTVITDKIKSLATDL